MSVRTNETEESCTAPIEAARWSRILSGMKIEALRDAILNCHRGFWGHHRELKEQTERTLDAQARRIDSVCERLDSGARSHEARARLLEKRVSELERTIEREVEWPGRDIKVSRTAATDGRTFVLGHVDGKTFTADDVRRSRRVERIALELASMSWRKDQAPFVDFDKARGLMRKLAEEFGS